MIYQTHTRSATRRLLDLTSVGLVVSVLILASCADGDDTTTGGTDVPVSASATDAPTSAGPPTTQAPASTPTTGTAAGPPTVHTTPPDGAAQIDDDLTKLLQQIVDDAVSNLPNPEATIQATVLRGSTSETWSGASTPTNGVSVPFRMASVGKTFTAATILRLTEDGALALDDPIDGLLAPETAALLNADGYRLGEITVNQLLHHTAGFYDYGFGDGSPFLQRALADFSHVWTRAEQLQMAVDFGDPLADPGVAFRYDDTGYVLLGEIIEQTTGKPYAVAMREILDYERLGLNQLWLESGEPAPDDALPIARSFIGTTEITELDFSIDAFGGGGLAATGLDIARFYNAIFDGEVFRDAATLELMLQVPDSNLGLEEFGVPLGDGASGLYRLELAGNTCWNHRGFLGTIAITCPTADITVVVTTNTANTEPLPIATALIAAVTSPTR